MFGVYVVAEIETILHLISSYCLPDVQILQHLLRILPM